MTSGVYQLLLRLPRPRTMQIGRLGRFTFPAGWYVYTGSALNGLEARIARHLRRKKRLHWHIDYLLQQAEIEAVFIYPTQEREECARNAEVLAQPGARIIAPRFGASDCRCPAHLVYLGNRGEKS
ncbi:MAG TPA: GIY-YIG nuclease family protein [Armatimonadetes bacterium]|nr:GIY-YIG nuclease family protein [Armatimonadota bacterium]